MENTKKTGLEIKEQAYRWHLLLEDGSSSTAQRREFETWLRQDPRHRDAYERAAVAWAAFARLKRGDLGLDTSANDSLKPRPDNPPSRLRALREKRHRPALRVAVPLAAAAAIAAIALSIAIRQPSRPFDSNPPVLANYASERGEIKPLTLPDGSRVTLASLTELSVSLSSGARAAALIKGAAIFDVAADPARPFSVDAGGVSATALGTVFEVRNNGGVVRVAVAEGEVELARPFLLANQPTSLVQRNALTAGEFASLRLDSDQVILGSFKAQDFACWRQSRLNYEGATLKEIIADANRYSARRIVLQGDHEKVQSLTMTGFFNSDDVDEMLATLTEVFPVTIERTTPEKIVVRID